MSETIQEKIYKGRWLVLITVIVGTFLGRLDQTIVGLATPKIIDDFGITVSAAGWISTAYIIANAVFVPIWGKLGDLVGRKKVYILGFLIFIFGSVLAGFAWDLSSMIVFRVIQAIAGSADYPTAMSILVFTFTDDKERAKALGIWSAAFAAAAVFGPLIGGPLIDNFGWPSIFLLNLPVGIIGLVMAIVFVHESKNEKDDSRKFDWFGALSLGVALASLVLVLEKGNEWGWSSINSLISYIVTLVSGFVFVVIEKKQEEPIVDLKFFKNSVFVAVLVNNFIVFMGMMGAIFLIPVFAQIFLGYGATATGLLFMPMAFAMMLSAPFGSGFADKFGGRNVILFSSIVATAGIFGFTFIDPKSGPMGIMIPLFIMALGMGFGMAPRTNIVSTAVPKNEIGSASSVLALVRNISGAFGIALFTTIFTNSTKGYLSEVLNSSTINNIRQVNMQDFVALAYLKAQILAYKEVFFVSTGISILGILSSFLIKVDKNKKMEKVHVE